MRIEKNNLIVEKKDYELFDKIREMYDIIESFINDFEDEDFEDEDFEDEDFEDEDTDFKIIDEDGNDASCDLVNGINFGELVDWLEQNM